jgi:LPXTG-motif cell wall-anchored protein
MSYIEKSLGEGEQLVALAHFPWTYSLKSWLALIVPVAILIAIETYGDAAPDWLTLAGLALIGLGLIVFLSRMIRKWTTELGVTSHRFVKKTGWFSLHTNEIALPNIEGVKVSQGFWGGVWGYGNLRIEGTGIDAVDLPTIADPIGFRRAIETAKGIKA